MRLCDTLPEPAINPTASSHLADVPTEILQKIVAFADLEDILLVATSRVMRAAAEERMKYHRQLFMRFYKSSTDTESHLYSDLATFILGLLADTSSRSMAYVRHITIKGIRDSVSAGRRPRDYDCHAWDRCMIGLAFTYGQELFALQNAIFVHHGEDPRTDDAITILAVSLEFIKTLHINRIDSRYLPEFRHELLWCVGTKALEFGERLRVLEGITGYGDIVKRGVDEIPQYTCRYRF